MFILIDIFAFPTMHGLCVAVAPVTVLPLIVRILVASGCTTPCPEVADRRVTLTAQCPPPPVITRINPEKCRIMVHRIRRPHARAVTRCAIMRELLRHMVRVRHLLEIRLMTLVTIRVYKLVVAIHVT